MKAISFSKTIFLSTSIFLFGILVLTSFALRASDQPKLPDFNILSNAKEVIQSIKKDAQNTSFDYMMNNSVGNDHRLSAHGQTDSYFLTDNKESIRTILSKVLNDPDGSIEKPNKKIVIYKTFDFDKDIKPIFEKANEPKDIIEGKYLGVDADTGKTNRVVVIIDFSKAKKAYGKLAESGIIWLGTNLDTAYPRQN